MGAHGPLSRAPAATSRREGIAAERWGGHPDGRYELLDCGTEADRDEILAWVAFHLKGVQVVIK